MSRGSQGQAPPWPRLLLLLVAGAAPAAGLSAPTEESPEAFFRTRIEPVLADSCLRCHGPTEQRSGLRLDSRVAVLRGGHGAIVVPGDPSKSRLLDALSYEDEELQMPPDGKLTAAQIADFTRWIELGVPWDDPSPSATASSLDTGRTAPSAGHRPSPPALPRPLGMIARAGRLHPLVIHFPIALLLVAAGAELTGLVLHRRGRASAARWCEGYAAGSTIAGTVTALAAVTLGWILYRTGAERGTPLAWWHGLAGVCTVVLAATASAAVLRTLLGKGQRGRVTVRVLLLLVAGSIIATAHLGGSLVYGVHYLW